MTAASSWSGRRAAFPAATRRLILDRAGWRCQIAGPDCTSHARIADHIVPMAEGGTHDPANGQAACDPCHDAKTREEIARGRARRSRKRPPPRHPGLIDPAGGGGGPPTPGARSDGRHSASDQVSCLAQRSPGVR